MEINVLAPQHTHIKALPQKTLQTVLNWHEYEQLL